MKVVALREAKQRLSGCVVRAQRERVLITKQRRPAALIDEETLCEGSS
jgi:antitoxin (DNA-binding transcriptional repressor) of toxin-antitoxin stability system